MSEHPTIHLCVVVDHAEADRLSAALEAGADPNTLDASRVISGVIPIDPDSASGFESGPTGPATRGSL